MSTYNATYPASRRQQMRAIDSLGCAFSKPGLKAVEAWSEEKSRAGRGKTINHYFPWIVTSLALAVCLGALFAPKALAQAAMQKSYEAASIHAQPGLQCKLFPTGSEPSKGIAVYTDDDGYARFHAVRAEAGGAVKSLTLDCTDSAGKSSSYAVDLTSAETFAPHPIDLATERGIDRPALKGDPLSYTQEQLIQSGYGLRPDPKKDAAAYAMWLEAASRHGRMLEGKRPDMHEHTVTSSSAPWWVGSALTGAPSYISTVAVFNVPKGIPSGDGTTTTEIAIWNGLGGYGTGSGLIQGGVSVETTPGAAGYGSWREYCCGDGDSNGYGGAFVPSPGDQIYSQEWYCDARGNLNLNGGYGCTFLEDDTTGAILSCTQAGGSPCWSVKAISGMTLGKAAEFIIENQSPQVSSTSTAFTDFTPGVTMSGSAYTSKSNSYSQTISSDPGVNLLTDFTNTTTHIVVALGSSDQTYFNIEPAQPSYPLYCHGPLSTSNAPTPLTAFKWASKGAGAAAPGPGECAWADRGPRGIEIKSGGGNEISGYLNQLANLPAGKYSEIGVYRDPNADNDMVVTKIVGFVTPPFSASPVLP
jgi:hypothetical protein